MKADYFPVSYTALLQVFEAVTKHPSLKEVTVFADISSVPTNLLTAMAARTSFLTLTPLTCLTLNQVEYK